VHTKSVFHEQRVHSCMLPHQQTFHHLRCVCLHSLPPGEPQDERTALKSTAIVANSWNPTRSSVRTTRMLPWPPLPGLLVLAFAQGLIGLARAASDPSTALLPGDPGDPPAVLYRDVESGRLALHSRGDAAWDEGVDVELLPPDDSLGLRGLAYSHPYLYYSHGIVHRR
jgi:hypothetical protein